MLALALRYCYTNGCGGRQQEEEAAAVLCDTLFPSCVTEPVAFIFLEPPERLQNPRPLFGNTAVSAHFSDSLFCRFHGALPSDRCSVPPVTISARCR